ncbi:MAG: galactose mutarotase [Acidobacteria bacterium]|nr:MAG: galactose mutarotase [Acidobacteriota bacterium]
MRRRIVSLVLMVVLAAIATVHAEGKMRIEKSDFGKTRDGQPVDLYTLTNDHGTVVTLTNWGASIVSIQVPDRSGKKADVLLGYDNAAGYIADTAYLGATVGRYGNRIGEGRFKLDGKEYKLAQNNGENHLHGGTAGFNKRLWEAKEIKPADGVAVQMHCLSKDGEEGYPGNLDVTVTFTLNNKNEVKIDYVATTDKPTVLNLTNHSYFNLLGDAAGDILGHEIMINADRFTPVDVGLIPTGELRPVAGTPLDFTQPKAIGARINDQYEQLVFGKGYDHNWVINQSGAAPRLAARLSEPKSGRVMEVLTTEPGLQFYSGNFLDGTIKGKKGKVYQHRYGLCLETQHFPDSPNKPDFPSTTLKPGGKYQTTTIYRFSTK